LPEHETVFAMTIHKSQGSEFEHAMVVLPQVQSPILTRELIYTGVTRAQKKMTLLGSTEILKRGLQETVRRASGLQREVWGA
jgi:exodeoxyribonuclease V alpha subunit